MTLKTLTRADLEAIEARIDDRHGIEIDVDLVEAFYEGRLDNSHIEGRFEHRVLSFQDDSDASIHWKRVPNIVGNFSVARNLSNALTGERTLLSLEQIDDPTEFFLYHWKAAIRDPDARCQVVASHPEIGGAIMLATIRYLIIIADGSDASGA